MRVLIGAVVALALLAVFAGSAVALNSSGDGPGNIVLVTNGLSVTNTQSPPNTPTFAAWCSVDGPCSPSTMQPVHDAMTGELRGKFLTWTKNFVTAPDGSLCFGEFVWMALAEGNVYMHSGSNGTCGGPISSLKPPTHIGGAPGQVIGGGGDGTIVGGTGKFSKWAGGTYTDRLFAELNFSGGPGYYDQLFWSISKN